MSIWRRERKRNVQNMDSWIDVGEDCESGGRERETVTWHQWASWQRSKIMSSNISYCTCNQCCKLNKIARSKKYILSIWILHDNNYPNLVTNYNFIPLPFPSMKMSHYSNFDDYIELEDHDFNFLVTHVHENLFSLVLARHALYMLSGVCGMTRFASRNMTLKFV